ncbi:DUF4202 domain-containing protein [Myxococcota bacterium]|nr:DUF4202 domain-containing protein [Myxococcota bacterium]
MGSDRLSRAIAAIDAANADDPQVIVVHGKSRPKEQAHAELATTWVEALCDEPDGPSEVLRLAARAHHLRRWEIPRSTYPEGRRGYHRWRRDLQAFHADGVAAILEELDYGPAEVERVRALVTKQKLSDPETQILEDALCLVFLETQFHELAERLDEDKLIDVTRRTLAKMSSRAIACAGQLELAPGDLEKIQRALA